MKLQPHAKSRRSARAREAQAQALAEKAARRVEGSLPDRILGYLAAHPDRQFFADELIAATGGGENAVTGALTTLYQTHRISRIKVDRPGRNRAYAYFHRAGSGMPPIESQGAYVPPRPVVRAGAQMIDSIPSFTGGKDAPVPASKPDLPGDDDDADTDGPFAAGGGQPDAAAPSAEGTAAAFQLEQRAPVTQVSRAVYILKLRNEIRPATKRIAHGKRFRATLVAYVWSGEGATPPTRGEVHVSEARVAGASRSDGGGAFRCGVLSDGALLIEGARVRDDGGVELAEPDTRVLFDYLDRIFARDEAA